MQGQRGCSCFHLIGSTCRCDILRLSSTLHMRLQRELTKKTKSCVAKLRVYIFLELICMSALNI